MATERQTMDTTPTPRPNVRLARFVPETAEPQAFEALARFLNAMRREVQPDDPPRPLQAVIDNARGWALLPDITVHAWHLWREDEIVAHLFATVAEREDNRHLLDVRALHVLPAYRRRGLARLLLAKLLELAEGHDRRLLLGATTDRVPEGAALAERLGARPGLAAHTNQLELAELNRELLDGWLSAAPRERYALEFRAGPYPEAELSAIAELLNAMNTAPRGDLEVEDFTVTPERLRQWERYRAAQGLERWALFALERSSGALAGATIVYFDARDPALLLQDDTVVVPAHRGHGLGKWLKAAMLEKVLRERPQVERVRTGNADANAPMLAINHALGFKPYVAETVWQLTREELRAYLSEAGLR